MAAHRHPRARFIVAVSVALGATLLAPSSVVADGAGGQRPAAADSGLAGAIDAHMDAVNRHLESHRAPIRLYATETFQIGNGIFRIGNRFRKYYGQRWVPGDVRRDADGDRLTYLVDQSDGATSSGLSNAQTEAALDRVADTWAAERCLAAAPLVKRADSGADHDILDGQLLPVDYEVGTPVADIVFAGWYPIELFVAFAPSFEGRILAFSETYIFVDEVTFEPTDVNGDGYLDAALNEVYFNDAFGDPDGPRPDRAWALDPAPGSPDFDVEGVALHEMGHSLGLGHFGPPPLAAMNPGAANRAGAPHTYPSDRAAICSLYASWPRP